MTQITISKSSSAQWTATFSNPPINLIDPDTIGELQDLVTALENDAEVKIVVFRSADPDFFMAHWDVLADKGEGRGNAARLNGHAPMGRRSGATGPCAG